MLNLKELHSSMKDDQGRYRTQSLFWELRHRVDNDQFPPLFTLKPYDLEKPEGIYPSLKKIYMSYDHIPTLEYEFATDVFGSWDHWVKLCDSTEQIRQEIQAWRDELDIRLKAEGLKALILASKDNDAKGVQASKYLVEKGYITKRGRPSKQEVEGERKAQAKTKSEFDKDMERIGLKIVEGGK